LVTDVSEQTISPNFKGQEVKEKIFLGCLTPQNRSDIFCRNVSNLLHICLSTTGLVECRVNDDGSGGGGEEVEMTLS